MMMAKTLCALILDEQHRARELPGVSLIMVATATLSAISCMSRVGVSKGTMISASHAYSSASTCAAMLVVPLVQTAIMPADWFLPMLLSSQKAHKTLGMG